jgi:ATP-dependent Clp protease ATP-binding subunit ClpC
VLDEGTLTDSLGRKVDFKNTVIIMTSNLGARQVKDFGNGVGFGTEAVKSQESKNIRGTIEKSLKKAFSPEFLNRVDEIVIFNSLEKEDLKKIIDIELQTLVKRTNELGYKIKISKKALNFLCEKGYDKKYGARPLKRAIQKYVEDLLADEIVKSKLNIGDAIIMDWDGDSDYLTMGKSK